MNAFLTKEMGQFIEVHDRAHSVMLQSASSLLQAAALDGDEGLRSAAAHYMQVMNSEYIEILKRSRITVEQLLVIKSPKKEFQVMTSSEKIAQAFGETGI